MLANIFLANCSFAYFLWEPEQIAHLSCASWAICSQSLISSERPERFAYVRSFVLSDWANCSQLLIWFEQNERMSNDQMSKFPALQMSNEQMSKFPALQMSDEQTRKFPALANCLFFSKSLIRSFLSKKTSNLIQRLSQIFLTLWLNILAKLKLNSKIL